MMMMSFMEGWGENGKGAEEAGKEEEEQEDIESAKYGNDWDLYIIPLVSKTTKLTFEWGCINMHRSLTTQ